jgi:DNA-binding NarL/FixJ family response regulator
MKHPARILIVEDQSIFARSLHDSLVRALSPEIVRIEETVAGAKLALEEMHPDLVALDLGLPDGSGFDVITACKTRRSQPKLVVVTIFDDDRHLFEALRRGVDGYVLKEESGEELVTLLLEILDGRPPLSPSIARRVIQHFAGESDAEATQLTERELTILTMLAKGSTVVETAAHIQISQHTVQHHVKKLYKKLEVHSRAEMTRAAIDMGIV